ncbi:unnamed protein product [Sphagnum balticum]
MISHVRSCLSIAVVATKFVNTIMTNASKLPKTMTVRILAVAAVATTIMRRIVLVDTINLVFYFLVIREHTNATPAAIQAVGLIMESASPSRDTMGITLRLAVVR